jgi:hypothetical protein
MERPFWKKHLRAVTVRMRDEEAEQHRLFGETLRQFYKDDSAVIQILRQRFPALADEWHLGEPQEE